MNENLKFIHNNVIDWIKNADVKANYFLAFNLSSIIFISNYYKPESNIIKYSFMFYILINLFCLFFLISIYFPRLKSNLQKSNIFFFHISDSYQNDQINGVNKLVSITDVELNNDLASQIIVNSTIAKQKFSNFKKFIICFIIEIIIGIFIVIANKIL